MIANIDNIILIITALTALPIVIKCWNSWWRKEKLLRTEEIEIEYTGVANSLLMLTEKSVRNLQWSIMVAITNHDHTCIELPFSILAYPTVISDIEDGHRRALASFDIWYKIETNENTGRKRVFVSPSVATIKYL